MISLQFIKAFEILRVLTRISMYGSRWEYNKNSKILGEGRDVAKEVCFLSLYMQLRKVDRFNVTDQAVFGSPPNQILVPSY